MTNLTATVGGASPSGYVLFYDGSTLLGNAPIVGGVATLPATLRGVGNHTITMVYNGDSNNAASTGTMTIMVVLAPEVLMPVLKLLLD